MLSSGQGRLNGVGRILQATLLDPFVKEHLRVFTTNENRADLETLAGMLADGRIRSVIDRTFPLEQTVDAFRILGIRPHPRQARHHHLNRPPHRGTKEVVMVGPLVAIVGLVLAALVIAAGTFVIGMRRKWPAVTGAVIGLSKRFINPGQLRTAGAPGTKTGIVHHRGRRSGTPYATPVDIETDG